MTTILSTHPTPTPTQTTPPIQWTSPTPGAQIARADWLDAARSLKPSSIDLVYVDPPFNTGRTRSDRAGAYEDTWQTQEEYLNWLRIRLAATIPLLKPTGSILLHLDCRVSHRARLILDDLLGVDRFINHLIWTYGLGGSSPRRFARKHDDILFYAVDPDRYWFDPPMVPATSRRMQGQLKKATDVLAIPTINNMAKERVGWPTQKPIALLDVLVRACCQPAGVVLDPCFGSGTTLVAAVRAGRQTIGVDVNDQAVKLCQQRLALCSTQ